MQVNITDNLEKVSPDINVDREIDNLLNEIQNSLQSNNTLKGTDLHSVFKTGNSMQVLSSEIR